MVGHAVPVTPYGNILSHPQFSIAFPQSLAFSFLANWCHGCTAVGCSTGNLSLSPGHMVRQGFGWPVAKAPGVPQRR
jgi:hypothetical protein